MCNCLWKERASARGSAPGEGKAGPAAARGAGALPCPPWGLHGAELAHGEPPPHPAQHPWVLLALHSWLVGLSSSLGHLQDPWAPGHPSSLGHPAGQTRESPGQPWQERSWQWKNPTAAGRAAGGEGPLERAAGEAGVPLEMPS